MRNFLNKFKLFLEGLDKKRDQILFVFIKKYWPRWLKPNHLTYVRLIIGVLLFILLFYYGIENKTLIILLFVLGVLTDLFDGSVARCLKMETKFGAFLDPIADRIIILPIAIYSLIGGHHWLLLTLLILETINGLASIYATANNIPDDPNIFGKTKMVLQSIAFGLILIFWPQEPGLLIINILWLSVVLKILAVFLKIINLNFPKLNKKVKIKK